MTDVFVLSTTSLARELQMTTCGGDSYCGGTLAAPRGCGGDSYCGGTLAAPQPLRDGATASVIVDELRELYAAAH